MSGNMSRHRFWLLIALTGVLGGCQMMMSNDPQLQTIGELLDDNGQDPARLGIERDTELGLVHDTAVGETPVAIGYYDNILDLNAAPAVRFEAMRRAADLRVQAADRGEDMDGRQLARAVSIYQQLLRDFPDYSNPAQILYQLARAYQLQGNDGAAIAALHKLAYGYPNSQRAGDALFRAAEMLFIRGRFAEAAKDYQQVIALGESSRYWQVAQYKYAWSRYRMRQHDQAITAFISLLSVLLPSDMSLSTDQLEELLPEVPTKSWELIRDSLRGLSLSFAARAGGVDVGDYFSSKVEPSFYPVIYRNLADLLVEKRRFTDAASVYESFAIHHPLHDLAEPYEAAAISVYERGGFVRLGVKAKERYVARYQLESDYWQSRQPAADLVDRLRHYMEDIAGHHHAKAQKTADSQKQLKQQYFLKAASWYARILSEFPVATNNPKINMLYADALFDGGKTLQAAKQYSVTAYDYVDYSQAPDAALAVVKAYRRLATEVPDGERRSVLEWAIAASQKLAEHFPEHPEKNRVLLLAAEDLYAMGRYDKTIALVQPLLNRSNRLDPAQHKLALSIAADAQFALQRFAQAEGLYAELLQDMKSTDPLYAIAYERRAVALYRQAEAARERGDRQQAAEIFLRVAQLSPDATLRANAYFDAGSLWYQMKDWSASIRALESLRKHFPLHSLNADVDKFLADAYTQEGNLAQAAHSYVRISGRTSEPESTRRSAGLLSAQLFDQVGLKAEAVENYQAYLTRFPVPLLDAQQVRLRLAEMAGDPRTQQHWLRQIIAADEQTGKQVVEASRYMAARASLELARADVHRAKAIALSLPLTKSLPLRKRVTEAAIAGLDRAANYGYAEITTAATHELGGVYQSLAQALLHSERPKGITGEALEQYLILLEEEVFPFEEKAIDAYEANVQRVRQGLWNDSIRKSLLALSELIPSRYGKQVVVEDSYDPLY